MKYCGMAIRRLCLFQTKDKKPLQKISRERLQFAGMCGILLKIQMIMKCVDKEK